MKTIVTLMLVLMAINLMAQDSLKAFGPINFGMTKDEVKKAVRATEGMKLLTGQIHTDILGQRYWGYPEYDTNGFVGIMLKHYTGNWCALFRIYDKYQTSDFKFDINSLVKLFNEQYGEPTYFRDFVHPGSLELSKRIVIGEWKDSIKIIQVWEEYINAVAYPVITIVLKEKAELNGKIGNAVDKIHEEKTKKLF